MSAIFCDFAAAHPSATGGLHTALFVTIFCSVTVKEFLVVGRSNLLSLVVKSAGVELQSNAMSQQLKLNIFTWSRFLKYEVLRVFRCVSQEPISIRGSVRRSVGPSVRPSVRPLRKC